MKKIAKQRNQDKDQIDVKIDKLKSINQRLRRRLKSLNLVVEEAIDRTQTKRMLGKHKVVVNADHEALIKERKSKNTEK